MTDQITNDEKKDKTTYYSRCHVCRKQTVDLIQLDIAVNDFKKILLES